MKHRAAFLALAAVLCCLIVACQGVPTPAPTIEPTYFPSILPTAAPTPVISATPEPAAGKAKLNPVVFLAALIEQYEGDNRYARLSNLVPVFDRFALDTAILDYYKGMWAGDYDAGVFFAEDSLTVYDLPTPDGDIVTYAVLRLDVEGEGLALIFSRNIAAVEWAFVDWFPCAESGYTDYPDSEVIFQQVEMNSKYGWFLRVRGRRDHGTERLSVQTDWYDLTGRKHMLGYMSKMVAMWGEKDKWVGHIIESTDNLSCENEEVTLTVKYSGVLVDRNDYLEWDGDDITSVAFYAEDWQVIYALDSNGALAIKDEPTKQRMQPISLDNPDFCMWESISAKGLITMFPDMQKIIEESGTRGQKEAFSKLLQSSKTQ